MRVVRPLVLWGIGGMLYVLCELAFRGRIHWTMFIVGGLCFWLIGLTNEVIPWEMPIWQQCIIGAIIITAVEFIAGCIINIGLGWQVWDYSGLPFNIMGQVCLPFAVLWVVVAAVGIVLDDYLRYWIFRQEKPLYKLF